MTQAPVLVRTPRVGDDEAWRRLWAAYLDFYEATVSAEATQLTLERIFDATGPMFGRVAERDGVVVGFAICVTHEGTWSVRPTCYLEDLFVDPAARGVGIGRALLDDLVALGAGRGWTSIYWHTRADNGRARRLYDRYAAADGFVRYRLAIQPRGGPNHRLGGS